MAMESDLRREVELGEELPFSDAVRLRMDGW